MTPARAALRALLPFALHGAAREVDRAVGRLLHTTLDLPDFLVQAAGLLDARRAPWAIVLWVAGGAAVWVVLAWERSRRERQTFDRALVEEAPTFAPLCLRPALTLLAIAALAVRPTFPYGFTLPVALTQDWAIAQDAAALAAIIALRLPAIRLPAPRPASIFFMAFLAYALLVPPWARDFEGHPGNEPKYLRMGIALAHSLSLDVGPVGAPMEELEPRPLRQAASSAVWRIVDESRQMIRAIAGGRAAFDRSAIRASRVARQTVLGKDGGIYHVLAPGPSILLAPALRLDRALNLRLGTPGRLGLSLLVWSLLAAGLVAALFGLMSDATGRPGLSAVLSGAFAFTPPLLFYFFQFFPEMPGALLLTLALRNLLFRPRLTAWSAVRLGLLLAALPWLHQKFLPVWAVLTLMAVLKAVAALAPLRALVALVLLQAATLYMTALYNFAITGSIRPDALFLAWGPGGVTSAHVGQGFAGLLLDSRWGILPYAPVYLLAFAGLLSPGSGASRLRRGLPVAMAYYLTVASADEWHGAISNLGRYVLPLAGYLAALVGVAVAGVMSRRGAMALGAMLAVWTGLIAVALWRDPHAANDCTLLLARSTYADGHVYVPNLFIRTWDEGAPGLFARLLVWGLLVLGLGLWWRRAAAGRSGDSPARALAGVAASVLAAALLLERWPSSHGGPRFQDAIELQSGTTAFVSGSATAEKGIALARRGRVELLVRSRRPIDSVTLLAAGEGSVRVPGRPALPSSRSGLTLAVPLEPLGTFVGRRGVRESLHRQRLDIESRDGLALRLAAGPRPDGQ